MVHLLSACTEPKASYERSVRYKIRRSASCNSENAGDEQRDL